MMVAHRVPCKGAGAEVAAAQVAKALAAAQLASAAAQPARVMEVEAADPVVVGTGPGICGGHWSRIYGTTWSGLTPSFAEGLSRTASIQTLNLVIACT